jgi:SWI/SNF-related matrix-associated actin-dependent regulator 1 of chromatin subfamily A
MFLAKTGPRRYVLGCRYEEREIARNLGYRWDPRAKEWYTNDPFVAYRTLREVENNLAVDPAVATQLDQRLHLSRAVESALPVPTTNGHTLYPFQRAALEYLCHYGFPVLFALPPGAGKTIISLSAVNLFRPGRVLVVCPAIMRSVWAKEAASWLDRRYEIRVLGTVHRPGEKKFWIVNYEMLSKLLGEISPSVDLLILDECHYIKNPKAKRTKAVKQIKASNVIALSGTPILNRPIELWPLLEYVVPHGLGSNWRAFVVRYCAGHTETIWTASGKQDVWIVDGASNTKELGTRLRLELMYRAPKEAILPQLPPKTRQIIDLAANAEARELLRREREIVSETFGGFEELVNLGRRGNPEIFGQLSRIRRQLGALKAEQAVELIKDAIEEDGKVVVWCHHKDAIHHLQASFPATTTVAVTGETPDGERAEAIRRFQEDPKVSLFIGSIYAAGVGITLTAAHRAIFVELDWVPAVLEQAEDRIHRISQENPVLIQYLVFPESLDAYIAEKVAKKAKVVAEVMA